MTSILTGKHQKKIAWLLLFIFYGEFLATAYGYGRGANTVSIQNYLPVKYFVKKPLLLYCGLNGERIPFVSGEAGTKPELIQNNVPEEVVEQKKTGKEDKADIGGPGQPEMNSFKSVGADNMVNLFSGDFSYNIPLLDVGGYPVNIFYSAGGSMDQEASWVGYGWNINPGTISRTVRGLPDDYNGDDVVTKTQSIKPDITVGVNGSTGKEVLGVPGLGVNINAGIFYNNRRGVGLEAGGGFDYSPMKAISMKNQDEKTTKEDSIPTSSISAGINLNSQNGMTLRAGFKVYAYNSEKTVQTGLSTSINYSSRRGLTDMSLDAEGSKSRWASLKKCELELQHLFSGYAPVSNISFARSSFTPSIRMPMTSVNQFYSVKLGKENNALFKNGTIGGYMTEMRLDKKRQVQTKPAFGYMYYEKGNDNPDALLDFNRLQDGTYTHKTPVISVPVYTYDVFSISGEGTGGSFRGYRGNIGYVRDNFTQGHSSSRTVSLDLGGGKIFHGGTILGYVISPSEVGEWKSGNAMREAAKFNTSKENYQGFYFRNPGEQAIIDESFYNKMGGDQLIRPYLENTGAASPLLSGKYQVMGADGKVERTVGIDANSYRSARDKRTQVITYLTAEEADLVGLDKQIYSYTENVFQPGSCKSPNVRTSIRRWNAANNGQFYRKGNHLSEIDVLEADGRRYVYGIPVYQIKQKEVTFSIEPDQGNPTTQLTGYTSAQNSTDNKSGRDGLFQSEETAGYAHSFLLTGILSPDYTDVTGDGITDDDKGTAIKFNYSRVNKKKLFKSNYWQPYKWRMPVEANTARYNGGLKTDNKDDKALFTYGEKELWYMHSIESKNMVATFYISDRKDGNPVAGENGSLDATTGRTLQKKLDKINLYTKADYLKYGANARPIKTVHFDYDYSICPSYPLNDQTAEYKNGVNINAAKGKLTLKAIWFSYNGNNTQVKNKYVFKYAASVNNINANPNYNSADNDRWGNYKPASANPASLNNEDFPYTLQDPAKSNAYAAAWNLEKILLPGGAVMQVQYEADDYGFVQNKRASQMTSVAGFGSSATITSGTPISNKLYTWRIQDAAIPGRMDHRFVFFDLPAPLATKNDILQRYLQGFKQLLLKLWVKMPAGNIGQAPAYEPITIYGHIKDYGFAVENGNENHSRIYVELEKTEREGSPLMETTIQFLKDYLPSRAYPGYDVKDGTGAFVQLVRAVFGMMNSLFQGVMSFEKNLKLTGKCKDVDLSKSFARLNNPSLKKIGGGHRVKQITINDNWNRMTGQYDSYYGQQYDYTTSETVNGTSLTISSGVASYEPGIGNEENPFREVLSYSEKQFLGPTDHRNIELPVAETFFPTPMIGYSKVTVKSIHNKDNKNIKSGIGLQKTEFYTTRDFPVITDYTSFDQDSRHQHRPGVIQKVFNFDKKDFLTLTQGVRVVLNDMNGKLKSQTSYPENDLSTPVNYTGYFYRLKPSGDNVNKLDNIVPVISGPDGKITQKLIGRDVEVMNDFREHLSYTYSGTIPLNVDIFKAGQWPILIPTLFRMAFRDKTMYRSATTMKIVNEYGILDSVVNIDKGSVVGTKNMVFDAETGNVLISRTYNEFNKPVYQFSYPAWWAHPDMGPAYRNIDVVYDKVLFRNGRIEESPLVNMNFFESGDEILVRDNTGKSVAQSAACIGLGDPPLLPVSYERKIWALDIRKDNRNTVRDMIFIDRYGNPYNSANASIRIIRSGKRNMTSASGGSIVSLNNPVRTINNQDQVVIDNATDVINASAAEFREKWRTNDIFYAKDSIVTTVRQAPIQTINLAPTSRLTASATFLSRQREFTGMALYSNSNFSIYKKRKKAWTNGLGSTGEYMDVNSWLKYTLPPGMTDAKIVSAKLNLIGHGGVHTVYNSNDDYPYAGHGTDQPHHNGFEKPGGYISHHMNFKVSRMLTPWYGSSDITSWKRIFDDNASYNGDDVFMNHPPYPWLPPGFSTRNYYPDVKKLVQNMVDNMTNTNVTTGIKLSYVSNSSRIDRWSDSYWLFWRYCFEKEATITTKYYKCDNTNPVVYQGPAEGAPVNPPPGYAYCNTAEKISLCLSSFSKKQMNPYIEGVIGNWRPWRSYVYYGERRESNPTVATDIRKDGIIKDFEPFWAFDNANTQLAKTNSVKWVWNSEVTQYNRKGAELEDHDPLNRYNAGIYGYQESLPIAVVNNSRLRFSAFDGFEDYDYKDDPCEPFCKPSKRHFPTGVQFSQLDAQQSHTGKYSLKVNSGTSQTIDIKVSDDNTISEPDIRIKLDKTPYTVTIVTPKGIGLKGYYYQDLNWSNLYTTRTDRSVYLSFRGKSSGQNCKDPGNLPPGMRCNDITVRWKGKIQVITSGYYQFDFSAINNNGWVSINGQTVLQHGTSNIPHYNPPVYLTAGTLHTIQADFQQMKDNGFINVLWKRPGDTRYGSIDPIHLYPEGQESLANGSVVTQTLYCEKPDDIQAINNHLIDSLNLVAGQRMVVSLWVKKGTADCKCTKYPGLDIKVKDAAGAVVAALEQKEKIIEGWQQYEAVFFVPAGTKTKLVFTAPADTPLFVDDLRIHPFNANMKSFVYDPVTLRLTSELDENNYASFYEYDDDGTLIRTKKETRLGVKTITETRSATQKLITDF